MLRSVTIAADAVGLWLEEHGAATLVIVVVAAIGVRLLSHAIPPAIGRAVMREATPLTEHDLRKRADTLSGVLLGAAKIAVLGTAALMLVGELGIDIVPVIAGLGIGGIAIGLGAQSLVRDAINGVLILTENQYGKGDMIRAAGVQGWVEEVNLRRTVLRDADGTLHSVPNGEVKVTSNLTRGYSGVDLLVSVGAGSDVDRALALIDEAGQALLEDTEVAGSILEAPRVARIDNITAAGTEVRVTGRVTPGAQWRVSSALRRRIVRAFAAAGIGFGPAPPAAPPVPGVAPVTTLPAPPIAPPPPLPPTGAP